MPAIENNLEDLQYQLFESGELVGFVQYRMPGNQMWVLHSSLSHSYKSQALVTVLLGHVLEDARRSRLFVLPFCPALRVFMSMHPQYANLVPTVWRPRLTAAGPMKNTGRMNGPLDYVRLTGPRRARPKAPTVVAR